LWTATLRIVAAEFKRRRRHRTDPSVTGITMNGSALRYVFVGAEVLGSGDTHENDASRGCIRRRAQSGGRSVRRRRIRRRGGYRGGGYAYARPRRLTTSRETGRSALRARRGGLRTLTAQRSPGASRSASRSRTERGRAVALVSLQTPRPRERATRRARSDEAPRSGGAGSPRARTRSCRGSGGENSNPWPLSSAPSRRPGHPSQKGRKAQELIGIRGPGSSAHAGRSCVRHVRGEPVRRGPSRRSAGGLRPEAELGQRKTAARSGPSGWGTARVGRVGRRAPAPRRTAPVRVAGSGRSVQEAAKQAARVERDRRRDSGGEARDREWTAPRRRSFPDARPGAPAVTA
jgi:hypothetical protein